MPQTSLDRLAKLMQMQAMMESSEQRGMSNTLQQERLNKLRGEQGEKTKINETIRSKIAELGPLLEKIPSGPFGGRMAEWGQKVGLGSDEQLGAMQEYRTITNILFSQIARNIAAEKGTLSKQDIENIRSAMPQIHTKPVEQAAALKQLLELAQGLKLGAQPAMPDQNVVINAGGELGGM